VKRFNSVLQTNWDWRAAGNFMFGGTGSGLLLMTAAATYPDTPPMVLGIGALFFVGLGLFLVWLEMGRPWRFLNVFFHPQTSWMTREASAAVLFFILTLAGIVFRLPVLLVLAGLAGFAFLYCQARILQASKGIPAWREKAIVPLIIATGLAEGTGLLILMLTFISVAPPWTVYCLIAFLAFRSFSWMNYRKNLVRSHAPESALGILAGINHQVQIIGNAVPAVLLVVAVFVSKATIPVMIVATLCAVVMGWYMKFTIVTRAAQVQGYALGVPRKS